MDDPLIFVRAVHFAATISVTGVALFNVFVAQPVLRPPASPELRASVVRRLAWIAWICLALALLSGAAWFVFVSASVSDQPLETVLSDASILQAVLLDTDFGRDWLLRLLLIALLAGLLAADLREKQDSGGFLKLAIVLAAAGLAGTLAWAGHGIGGALRYIARAASQFPDCGYVRDRARRTRLMKLIGEPSSRRPAIASSARKIFVTACYNSMKIA